MLEVISELSHPEKFSYSCPQLQMTGFVTLSHLIFGKSLKFEACGCDLAGDLKASEQLINELLRKLHGDVPILETLDGST